jgi:Zn finger protein HypA/HybF involved in hydrogenase expression
VRPRCGFAGAAPSARTPWNNPSLAPGTRLEGAALLVDTFDTRFTCAVCGHSQTITSDDLTGHFFLCPICDAVQEIDEAHDLELIEVRTEE